MAKGIVTNVSKNPVELPDGSTLAPGETRQDFDEATLKDNIFLNGGWLVVGKDAKALQDQLDSSDETVKELQAKVDELQAAVSDLTLRATTAEAERDQLQADAKAKK